MDEFGVNGAILGVNAPTGFKVNGVSCGLKESDVSTKDIGLVLSEVPCRVACAFTKNQVKAAPVLLDMSRMDNPISAILVNSGNANCLTGKVGDENALAMATKTEGFLNLPAGSVMVASTGVIGRQLKMDRVDYGIEKVCHAIETEDNIKNFSHAIMTTDMKMKNVATEIELSGRRVIIGGSAKGAGMIKPHLQTMHATMLVFIATDAAISQKMLSQALKSAVDVSFNRISVDNDTSTNDSVFLLANGMAENIEVSENNADYKVFVEGLTHVCQELAKMIVKDGEGASKLVKIVVERAMTSSDAEKAVRSIADSYLVKTAVFGQSPNWGRILAALGYSGAQFDINQLTLKINDLVLFQNGEPNKSSIGVADSEMLQNELLLTLDLGIGKKSYFMWTCDLSYDYVKINAHYLT